MAVYAHSQEDALRDAAASFRQDVTNGDAESGSPVWERTKPPHLAGQIPVPPVGLEPTLDGF